MTATSPCGRCGAKLSAWEPNPCGCSGITAVSNAEVLYVIACAADGPLHLRDYVRLADVDHSRRLSQATANATVAPNPMFCWAGKGVYGLYRHGPLPGPRNLEEAARLVLAATDQPLTLDAIEYGLKRIGYRFTSSSLYNAMARSPVIEWWYDGLFRVRRSHYLQRNLTEDLPVVPERRRAEWPALRQAIAAEVETALEERADRLRNAGLRNVKLPTNWE